jgi:hypothetical protein
VGRGAARRRLARLVDALFDGLVDGLVDALVDAVAHPPPTRYTLSEGS